MSNHTGGNTTVKTGTSSRTAGLEKTGYQHYRRHDEHHQRKRKKIALHVCLLLNVKVKGWQSISYYEIQFK
jgi:hypothetical protein